MLTVLPGKPQARLQALSTSQWDGLRLIIYVSGCSLVILRGPHEILQTIQQDDESQLDACAIDGATGKIATCSSKEITIYKPYGREEGLLKWAFQYSWPISDGIEQPLTLSWGSEEELLVGSSSLKLYGTAEENDIIWDCKLPKPVKFATFSPDASLVASTGQYDRLIKLWRRQSFGSDDTRFDFTYLPHPTAVTAIHWRRLEEHEHITDNVLYSVCGDSKIRIWAATDPHGLQTLQLWAEIDMQESIKPRDLKLSAESKERFAFIIDSKDFARAAERATGNATSGPSENNHASEHLAEIAEANPEVCVVLDRHGNMSAWGLESVGCKARKSTNVFNIAHVENVNLPSLLDVNLENNVQFLSFCDKNSASSFTILVQYLDGRIFWLESRLDEFFDPSQRQQRVSIQGLWTGHEEPIQQLISDESRSAFISCTKHDSLIWKQAKETTNMVFSRSSSLSYSTQVHHSCLLEKGDFVLSIQDSGISLWDARPSLARQVNFCTFDSSGRPLCLFMLPSPDLTTRLRFVATITSTAEALVWQVELPQTSGLDVDQDTKYKITELSSSRLKDLEYIAFANTLDEACSRSVNARSLIPAKNALAMTCTSAGNVQGWASTVAVGTGRVDWSAVSVIETKVNTPSLISGSSAGKIAIIDAGGTRLTTWDLKSAHIEHDIRYEAPDTIKGLRWSSTSDHHSILALQFSYKVVIVAQMRYDYLNVVPAWAPLREINIKELTSSPICDTTWSDNEELVLGTGNQLYVYEKTVAVSDVLITGFEELLRSSGSLSASELVTYLNSHLPAFHPQFLAQVMLAGKFTPLQKMILRLHKALKFYAPGDDLDMFTSVASNDFYMEQKDFQDGVSKGSKPSFTDSVDDAEPENLTEELAVALNENILKIGIPHLTSHEKTQVVNVIQCVAMIEKHGHSIDINARRYLAFFKQSVVESERQSSAMNAMTWREICWAYHSGSQDILVDLVSRQYQARMLWQHAKECGMFMWMNDITALRAQFEVIARNEYTKTYEKNPIDCSLYYLALKKKSVLVGLWRMAGWHREQSGTQKLLRNDFSEPRWKTAALKNAYALLGKRRFEYAAAFFLLAGNLQDAVNVCVHQMQDIQLGIAVARVYEGDESPVLRKVLEEEVLPQAAMEGNRWLASWAFWLLGQHNKAVLALVHPIHKLVDSSIVPKQQANSYLANESALIILYRQLRERLPPKSKGSLRISSREEWEFVLRMARTYDRMGCGLLALDLVRNWTFLEQPKATTTNGERLPESPKMHRRRSSAKVIGPKSPTKDKVQSPKKAAPTVFEEPSSNNLLDSFGF